MVSPDKKKQPDKVRQHEHLHADGRHFLTEDFLLM